MQQKVYIQKAEYGNAYSALSAVEKVFSTCAAVSSINSKSRVLIKPNLLAPHNPQKAVTTDPLLLKAVILSLQKRGVKHIVVADSPGGSATPSALKNLYKICGIGKVCEETGAEIYIGNSSSKTVSPCALLVKEFNLIQPFFECDFIINMPKLKTHGLMGFSGAVKNLFGLIPGLEKAEFHMRFPDKNKFGQMLVDLSQTVKANLHIVDAMLSMEGDGPSSGTPKQTNCIIAGENPYILDLFLCHFMSLRAGEMPTIVAANKTGISPLEFDKNLLDGDVEVAFGREFMSPATYATKVDFSSSAPSFLRPLVSVLAEKLAPKPVVDPKLCIGCAKCAEICPQQVILMKNGKAKISYKNCIKCFCCHEICPAHAIYIKRNFIFARKNNSLATEDI